MELAIERIRRDTANVHKLMESSPLAVDLMSKEICVIRYLEILLQWSSAWSAIESTLHQTECTRAAKILIPIQKSHYAKADINFLSKKFGIDEEIISLMKPKVQSKVPDCYNDSMLAGYCYVLRGSALGGQIIARHLSNHLTLERGAGVSFFNPTDAERLTWPEWRNAFNQLIVTQREYSNAYFGAQMLFRYLTNVFTVQTLSRGKND